MSERILKHFPTMKRAETFARAFDVARTFNSMPKLVVRQDGDQWAVVNPNIECRGHAPRKPAT